MAVRAFSISEALAASTVTPGSTAPDASFATPASVACANADAGSSKTSPSRNHTIRLNENIAAPLVEPYRLGLTYIPLRYKHLALAADILGVGFTFRQRVTD